MPAAAPVITATPPCKFTADAWLFITTSFALFLMARDIAKSGQGPLWCFACEANTRYLPYSFSEDGVIAP
jgi:hypothetical protein